MCNFSRIASGIIEIAKGVIPHFLRRFLGEGDQNRISKRDMRVLTILRNHACRSAVPIAIESVRQQAKLSIPEMDDVIARLMTWGYIQVVSRSWELDIRLSPKDPDPHYIWITDKGRTASSSGRHLQ